MGAIRACPRCPVAIITSLKKALCWWLARVLIALVDCAV